MMKKKRTRRMKSKKEEKMALLPVELLIQIMLRLPVKSLLRFRCVSKLWCSLISDPQFAISHFELAAAITRRVLHLESSTPEARSIDFDASLHDDSASASIMLNFQPPEEFYVEIVGSCRGFLLLFSQYSNFVVWNPSTGAHKQVPRSPIASSNGNENVYYFKYLYGFGYDPSTDDYLVFLMSYNPASDWASHFEFFSLRANSWKRIEDIHLPYMNSCDEPRVGSLLNGAIHWLVYRHDNVSMNVIVAFDLVERSFSDIPLPNDFESDFNCCHLCVLGGFLSLVEIGWLDMTNIWVMEEYKVQSSWTKSIVVPLNGIRYFSPICSTESGDIFGMDDGAGLVKCNAQGEVLEHRSYPHFSEAGIRIHMGAAMYTESLLSLPADSGQAEDE